eukprot:TRINITY_DN20761_c0_g1_i1.p2 TRINITY_DN20761_c0_g1~~TRINITY_DN20761_c0_g1_i1.p2  ORF type:complete len:180 (+),score=7.84 TRINITY_DN20761_c0_g1_i1:149-688(+)
MIRRPPRSTHCISSAASDVYKRQVSTQSTWASMNAPNAIITRPLQRLTLTSPRGARDSGENSPTLVTISPIMTKKIPEGVRKSSMALPEDNVQNHEQDPHHHSQRRRAPVPRQAIFLRDFGHPVYQPSQFLGRPRFRHQAHQDGHYEARGPRENGDPEVLRHGGRKFGDGRNPSPCTLR